MRHIRCNQCNKLLAKANYSQLEIKCSRCKTVNYLEAHEAQTQQEQPRGSHSKTLQQSPSALYRAKT